MEPGSVERRLAAILSADVVGYSRLMADDEDATVHTLTSYTQEIGLLVGKRGGRVVDLVGDNVLAEFPTALDAVSCAVEMQDRIAARNADLPEQRRMHFRVGIHLGDVRVEGERIFGDGVNIAARLEGLAEAGGVCISRNVYDLVRGKLDLGYENLGARAVKNIPEPVEVVRVRRPGEARRSFRRRGRRRRLRGVLLTTATAVLLLGAWMALTWPLALGLALDAAGVTALPVDPPLPERPSLVVLPFTNMSEDPEQEYFSDGITEDLTTDLSKNPGLFVISRNSAFTYKGKLVNVEDVGRELGVRYVLEGSVRRAEDRVRITAQLIDATSGFHVWSDRYDRELSDIFALQSEISAQILAQVGIEIQEAEFERAWRKPTDNLSAYDLFQRGLSHFLRFRREDNSRARQFFERAIELDGNFASAYSLLGNTYANEYSMGWNLDPALMVRAEELALRTIELNPALPDGYFLMAQVHLFQGRSADAIATVERVLESAPNSEYAHAFLGGAQLQQGQYLAGFQSFQRALRLNPRAPSALWTMLAIANLALERYEEGVELLLRVRAANPDMIIARMWLVVAFGVMGRPEDARAEVREILRVNPALTTDAALRVMFGGANVLDSQDAEEFAGYLRAAGLP